jgi:hypothetical protein
MLLTIKHWAPPFCKDYGISGDGWGSKIDPTNCCVCWFYWVIAKQIVKDSGGWKLVEGVERSLFTRKVAILGYSKMILFVKDTFKEECCDAEIGQNTFAAFAFLDIAAHVRLYNLHSGKPLKILRASANASTILFDDAPASQNK